VSSSTRSVFVSATTPLLGLRLPALVRGDDEQHQPNGTDAGEHVADEPLVTRDVDEADLATARQGGPGVAEVDRETATLLLGEPVRIDPGERDDERGLAMVHVACRRDDPEGAGHGSVLVVEVVALQGVEDGAGDVRHLLIGDGAHVEHDVVVVHPAEHRR
jgi:hypothetical protein